MRSFRVATSQARSKANSFLPVGLLLVLAMLSVRSQGQPAPLVLTYAAGVNSLSAELAPHARVHLIATVTYYDPLDNDLFVQDASGGVFVATTHLYPIHNGDLIEIIGATAPGYRTEIAPDPTIRVLGRGQKFPARHVEYSELETGKEDSQLVSIRGKVRAADIEQHENAAYMHLDVAMTGGEVEVYVGGSTNFDPRSTLGATVEIRATAGGVFDAKTQLVGIVLYAADASDIRILHPPAVAVGDLPLTDIDRVFEALKVDDTSRRIRVRGTVTYYRKGDSAVLEHNGKSIFVQTRETNDLAIGDVVNVIGLPSNQEYAPSLREATLVETGGREQIDPRPVSYSDAFSGMYSDNLISISGILVSQLNDGGANTLTMIVDGHLVNGSLRGRAALSPIPLGSRVRIVGICRILAGGPWRMPVLFHLEMRTPADVQVLSEPSWWSVRHLIALVSLLLILALAVAVWALLLRNKVSYQSDRIHRSMIVAGERTKILERIGSNESLDATLSEICKSVMALLPGFTCFYCLQVNPEEDRQENLCQDRDQHIYFEMPLIGDSGQVKGTITVSGSTDIPQVDDQHEVYSVLSELATLAMERSQLHQQLVHHSTHDPLTDLPNRRLCESRLQRALEEAARQKSQLALVYIDVNRFKQVNDRYGHKIGDLYLKEISARLLAHMRTQDTLARIGGDEFIIIASLPAHADAAPALVARLHGCFDAPFVLEERQLEGSASFGLAVYPEDGTTAEELTRNADQAMYISKRKADASAPAHDIGIITPDELELALKRDRFSLAYQPQFSHEGRLTGLEALIRLEDPILGTLTPDAFISVAERHDVIIEIGQWVLRRAMQDAIRWQLDQGDMMLMVVNVSVRQLEQSDFAEMVISCLQSCGFPASRLELEITERVFISDRDEVVRQLHQLREIGVRISLDDFGTGHSSLSLLHKLPIDTIKLDRSFILAIDEEPRVWPIIKAISFIANCMGKRIVAEGIEQVSPVPTLLKMGDIEFQGYLLSRPLPAAQVDLVIHQWRAGIEMPDAFRRVPAGRRVRLRQ